MKRDEPHLRSLRPCLGAEIDETPGECTNQPPLGTGPNSGDDQGAPITAVDGYTRTTAVTVSAAS